MDNSPITPASIIERFGGRRALAERLGIPVSTVGNWPSLGIPTKWFGRLMELASEDDLPLTWDELWETTNLRRAG